MSAHCNSGASPQLRVRPRPLKAACRQSCPVKHCSRTCPSRKHCLPTAAAPRFYPPARCAIAIELLLTDSLPITCLPAGELNFVLIGVILQLVSICTESTRLTLVQLLLQSRGLKLNPVTTM